MKKLMLFVAVISVVSLASCKKKTCTYEIFGVKYDCCTECTSTLKKACEASGSTCK